MGKKKGKTKAGSVSAPTPLPKTPLVVKASAALVADLPERGELKFPITPSSAPETASPQSQPPASTASKGASEHFPKCEKFSGAECEDFLVHDFCEVEGWGRVDVSAGADDDMGFDTLPYFDVSVSDEVDIDRNRVVFAEGVLAHGALPAVNFCRSDGTSADCETLTIVDAHGTSPAALVVGGMCCSLSRRTPALHLQADTDSHDGCSDFFVVPEDGGRFLCFGWPRTELDQDQRSAFFLWLRQRSSLLVHKLAQSEQDGVTVAPAVDEIGSDWLAAGVQSGSALFQRVSLGTARAVAVGCSRLSSRLNKANSGADEPLLGLQCVEKLGRLQAGLEVTRTSLQHASDVISDCVGRAVLHSGRSAAKVGSHVAGVTMGLGGYNNDSIDGNTCQSPGRAMVGKALERLDPVVSALSRPMKRVQSSLSASGPSLVAAAETAAVARGLMYVSLRQVTADVASTLLGPEAGEVVAEGLDTACVAQSTLSAMSFHNWRILAADSPSLANNLLYAGFKQGSSEVMTRRFGPTAGVMTSKGLENLSVHGTNLNSLSWALACASDHERPRILSTTIQAGTATSSVGGEDPRSKRDEEAGEEGLEEWGDTWILLGLPWKEGFLAMQLLSAQGGQLLSGGETGEEVWKRTWCVMQDTALAMFEHKRAAEDGTCASAPLVELEASEIVGLQLGSSPCDFSVRLTGKRLLCLRADTRNASSEWMCHFMRLASRRAVRLLQSNASPEWEAVHVS